MRSIGHLCEHSLRCFFISLPAVDLCDVDIPWCTCFFTCWGYVLDFSLHNQCIVLVLLPSFLWTIPVASHWFVGFCYLDSFAMLCWYHSAVHLSPFYLFGSEKQNMCFPCLRKIWCPFIWKKIDVKTGCLAVNSKPCLCEWIVCISIVAGGSPRCVWWVISDSLVVVWRLCDFTMCDFWGVGTHCLALSPDVSSTYSAGSGFVTHTKVRVNSFGG